MNQDEFVNVIEKVNPTIERLLQIYIDSAFVEAIPLMFVTAIGIICSFMLLIFIAKKLFNIFVVLVAVVFFVSVSTFFMEFEEGTKAFFTPKYFAVKSLMEDLSKVKIEE